MSSPRPPRRLCVQAWSGARIPPSLLSTILTAARCLFRICPSLWARAAVVFNSAFTTVLSSRLGRSAQCCCSNHPPGALLQLCLNSFFFEFLSWLAALTFRNPICGCWSCNKSLVWRNNQPISLKEEMKGVSWGHCQDKRRKHKAEGECSLVY